MCTLAILPSADGYLLGHNRDESLRRVRGLAPSRRQSRGRAFVAPRDPVGGGSWISASETGITFGLLNAAHAEPGRLPSRPPSRGTILDAVAHLADPSNVEEALKKGPPFVAEMRGFHLVMVLPGAGARSAAAVRFRWDGRSLQRDEHGAPALFVSSGFDQASAESARGATWRAFLERTREPGATDLEALLATHEPRRGVLSICMHGKQARTVSRTIVTVARGTVTMTYLDGAPCEAAGRDLQRMEIPRSRVIEEPEDR